MPLEDYGNYVYDFMETESCFKATVEDGTYDMDSEGGIVTATMTLVGEVREEGLRDEEDIEGFEGYLKDASFLEPQMM